MSRRDDIARDICQGWHSLLDRLVAFGSVAYAPLIVGAAVFAFFAQPLSPYLSAYRGYEGAVVLTSGLILMRAGFERQRDLFSIIFAAIAVWLGAYWLNEAIEEAAARAAANDRRCWHIEVEMLRAAPRRNDLPDLFEALGCRAQSDNLAELPAPRS